MNRILTAMLLCGLAAVAFSGCYVVSPYAYPPYPPTYPPPYGPPPPPGLPSQRGGPTGPPPTSPTPSPAPGASGIPQGPGTNCQTVTVEGHYETRIKQSGEQERIWVPTRIEQICQ